MPIFEMLWLGYWMSCVAGGVCVLILMHLDRKKGLETGPNDAFYAILFFICPFVNILVVPYTLGELLKFLLPSVGRILTKDIKINLKLNTTKERKN